VETWSATENLLHYTLIDGSGQVLYVENRTANESYNIFEEHPGNSPQTLVQVPGSTTESPNGWLGAGDQYSTYIRGNNTNAYLDDDNNNAPPTDGLTQVTDGDFLTDFMENEEPTTVQNKEVAVQNLFYLTNKIHDVLYTHGFNESAGNFQLDNFGKGGIDNDPLNAEAQDGSGTNNANMSTPSDGSSPRMQMYRTTYTTPNRDTDLDADVVWHEFGHGLTWRIVGKMQGHFGGAIGEGASDTLAIIIHDNPIVGEWSFASATGIRSASYEGYSRTYENWTSSSVHYNGEIYAAIMWELWKRYRDDASGDIGATQDARRRQLLDDIVQGMILTTYPSFPRPAPPSMRDGILYAISNDPDPLVVPSPEDLKLRWCNVWEAFAQFGVGTDQSTTFGVAGPFTWEWFEGFSAPAACSATPDPGGTLVADFVSSVDPETGLVTLNASPDAGAETYTWVIESWPGGRKNDPRDSLTETENPATFTAKKSGDYVKRGC
jgi:hypothetical protein